MDGGWRAAVARYAEAQPTFGGVFADGRLLVLLFTDDLEPHRQTIKPLVPRRGRVAVRKASRTFAALVRAEERVAERVMGRDDVAVTEVGIDLDGDEAAIFVSVYPYSDAAAERVWELAAPDEVVVTAAEGRPLPG